MVVDFRPQSNSSSGYDAGGGGGGCGGRQLQTMGQRVVQWATRYFQTGASNVGESAFRPPLYFQHQGHSRSIVGTCSSAAGKDAKAGGKSGNSNGSSIHDFFATNTTITTITTITSSSSSNAIGTSAAPPVPPVQQDEEPFAAAAASADSLIVFNPVLSGEKIYCALRQHLALLQKQVSEARGGGGGYSTAAGAGGVLLLDSVKGAEGGNSDAEAKQARFSHVPCLDVPHPTNLDLDRLWNSKDFEQANPAAAWRKSLCQTATSFNKKDSYQIVYIAPGLMDSSEERARAKQLIGIPDNAPLLVSL
jgi:hypothetical protein